MDTTGKACVEFWKWAPQKGLINSNTAQAIRVACAKVLGVLDNWETLDVAALDTEDVFSRFVKLNRNDFTPDSLQTYKSRFQRGLEMFLEYSKNPAGWRPKIQPQAKREKAASNGGTATAATTPAAPVTETPAAPPTTSRTGLVEYPFPLRDGRFAYLRLPTDLTAADVKRLTGFLNTLALEDVA